MARKDRRQDHASIVRASFARQAREFAHSPLQTDPVRLRRLVEYIGPRPGERALDVACGPGIVTSALERAGVVSIGIDLTHEMIREAGSQHGTYLQGDVERLPFDEATFDVAVCRNSFHHFAEPEAVTREMARVLRRGGRVVVEDMCAPDDPQERAYHETIERLRDVSHARTLSRDEFRAMALSVGLVEFEEMPASFVIDFDEWMDRAYPAPGDRERARRMMQASVERRRAGLKVWSENGRLKFERRSLLWRAVRPGE